MMLNKLLIRWLRCCLSNSAPAAHPPMPDDAQGGGSHGVLTTHSELINGTKT